MVACASKHAAIAEMLMPPTAAAGALDTQDKAGQTALMCATIKGLASVLRKLLELGAKSELTNTDGKSALNIATDQQDEACLEVFTGNYTFFVAARMGWSDKLAEFIAAGADVTEKDAQGMTALLVACAAGHAEAAKMLVPPTLAAGAADVRSTALLHFVEGDEGYSGWMWAEEWGLSSVVQMLREGGAARVSRPPLALFRGMGETVQLDVTEQTVAFSNNRATLRSTQRCPLGAKGYYELEILGYDNYPQYGFAAAAFARVLGASNIEVGDDALSWAVDGENRCTMHNNEQGEYACKWKTGDVVGLACDLESMQLHVSVNGSFAAPNGVVFALDPDTVRDGLFAAFTGIQGKLRYNLGAAPFTHAAPSADYKGFVEFAA